MKLTKWGIATIVAIFAIILFVVISGVVIYRRNHHHKVVKITNPIDPVEPEPEPEEEPEPEPSLSVSEITSLFLKLFELDTEENVTMLSEFIQTNPSEQPLPPFAENNQPKFILSFRKMDSVVAPDGSLYYKRLDVDSKTPANLIFPPRNQIEVTSQLRTQFQAITKFIPQPLQPFVMNIREILNKALAQKEIDPTITDVIFSIDKIYWGPKLLIQSVEEDLPFSGYNEYSEKVYYSFLTSSGWNRDLQVIMSR